MLRRRPDRPDYSISSNPRVGRERRRRGLSVSKLPLWLAVIHEVERGGDHVPIAVRKAMVFDLICRGCGACAQREWDPTEAVSATTCPDCDEAMAVIGIDFPAGREEVGLTEVLKLIQGAGIVPVAVERRARGHPQAEAA